MIDHHETQSSLTADASAFVERFGLWIAEMGLPPSIARVLGLLLVCEPSYQSASAIQQQLRLSVGSVSTALLMLQKMMLVRKTTFPEDRHFYYELDPECWQKLLEARRQQIKRGVKLAEEASALSKDNVRVENMHQFLGAFDAFLEKSDHAPLITMNKP